MTLKVNVPCKAKVAGVATVTKDNIVSFVKLFTNPRNFPGRFLFNHDNKVYSFPYEGKRVEYELGKQIRYEYKWEVLPV